MRVIAIFVSIMIFLLSPSPIRREVIQIRLYPLHAPELPMKHYIRISKTPFATWAHKCTILYDYMSDWGKRCITRTWTHASLSRPTFWSTD